ncbi:MAG: SDR family oxidoreductase [Candidatus Omnitrophica bacterium]|nr:SDR family oxidoreductase [Candidatus Omnitrophota bacterium]
MSKPRLLITGVSGLLGSNLARYFCASHDVFGLYHQHPIVIDGVRILPCNLLEAASVGRVIRDIRPDSIVHCAAIADIDRCEEARALAHEMNVGAACRVADAAQKSGVYLMHISTDNVFDGRKGDYVEGDPVGPLSYYAETKAEAERALLGYQECSIMRTSFYGSGGGTKRSLIEWAVGEISLGHQINGFTDAITSNIYVMDLARMIEAVLERRLAGLYHAACRNARSKYDFLNDLVGHAGQDKALVVPCSVDAFSFKAKRPKNIGLNVGKLMARIGSEFFPSSEDSLAHLARDCRFVHGFRGISQGKH